jgi:hypothetical protein
MHTLASRMSARERELAPRYYYKRANATTWFQKIKNALRAFLSFLFTQVILFLFPSNFGASTIFAAFEYLDYHEITSKMHIMSSCNQEMICRSELW